MLALSGYVILFCSFQNAYTSWQPNPYGKQFLCNLQRFKEKQIRKYTFQAMEESQLVLSSRGPSCSNIFLRLLSRDVFPGNGIIYKFSPLGLLDTDQRAYPYILDWYYTCHSEHLGRNAESSNHPMNQGRIYGHLWASHLLRLKRRKSGILIYMKEL